MTATATAVGAVPSNHTAAANNSGSLARVLLVSGAAFDWLRRFQGQAPSPRLELRYLAEGAIVVATDQVQLREAWLLASREALLEHLSSMAEEDREGAACAPSACTGTGAHTGRDEGASARTLEARSRLHRLERLGPSKALQVGELVFQRLKRVQGTTREPRLEMRYLVDGAIQLLTRDAALWPTLVSAARQALTAHLAELVNQPVVPFPMEIHR